MSKSFGVLQQLVLLGLVFIMSFFLRTAHLVVMDHTDYISWTEWFLSQGISNAFAAPRFDYGPSAVYLLTGFGLVLGGKMAEFHLFLRQFYFLFDLGAIFLLMWYLDRSGRGAVRALFVLFNIAFIYNSLLWGQSDGVFTAVIFASLLAALTGRPELAVVLFVVAFNLKPQPIIYFPLIGPLVIAGLVRQPRRLVTTIAAAIVAQLVLLLPFLANGAWRDWVSIYTRNVNAFPIASFKAGNFWYLVLAGDPTTIADTNTFMQLTFKAWGLVLFGAFSLAVMLPIGVRTVTRIRQRGPFTAEDGALVFLTAALINLVFFFFNTQMHERYSFPAVFFLGAYAMLAYDYFLYVLVSIAHLLNINFVFSVTGMSIQLVERNVTLNMVAVLFLVVVVAGLVQLYRAGNLSSELRALVVALREQRAKSVALLPAAFQD